MNDVRFGGVGGISGSHNVTITDPQAPVYINELRKAAASRWLSADRSSWLSERFVAPDTPAFREAQAKLREPGIVVVAGAAGSGRQTAARMLLQDSRPDTVLMQSVVLDDDENEVSPSPESVGVGDRLLLDLTAVEPGDLRTLLHRFESFRAEVERRAHLLVVLPVGYRDVVEGELAGRVHDLGRPAADKVLRRHLERDGIVPRDEDLTDDKVREFLAASSMQQVANLAQQVRQQGDGSILGAVEALSDQSADAADLVVGARDGRCRALLLVAAMFDGGSADTVHLGYEQLLATLDYPVRDDHPLDENDLAHALEQFRISVAPSGQIGFGRIGMDAAVRSHIWRHYPGLRAELSKWAREFGRCDALTPSEHDEFTWRLAAQLLAVDRPDDIRELAESWTREGHAASPNAVAALEKALRLALEHPKYASMFRHVCYEWARQPTLPPALAQLVINVSATVIATSVPDQAIVRLHHLTHHNDPAVAQDAASTLLGLADAPPLWPRVLRRLCVGPYGNGLRAGDDELFVELIRPRVVGASAQLGPVSLPALAPAAERQLAMGWRALLSRPGEEPVRTAMSRWLSVSVHAESLQLLDILVEATEGQPPLLGQLFRIGRLWANGGQDGRRRLVLARLRERINVALGVQHLFSDVPKGFSG
ncbi:hypothetical protein [Kutzneria buriramensis]|uniref:Uncharacterized protein n=1 Tax=Kutzneria buriramensis TaxID=1045776 RepID=A0A3E0HKZ9_9PSEU|nr:hypothetical protein [Kutzneria buriramensis]REH47020.1 hypothetical protein BCF44_106184 [Kutzneria buriramensis]